MNSVPRSCCQDQLPECSSDHVPHDQDGSDQEILLSSWTSSFRQYSGGMAEASLPPIPTPPALTQ